VTSLAPATVEWIAVDWGTTNLRAWAMAGDMALASREAPLGMGSLRPQDFEPALVGLVGDWLAGEAQHPVVICGMAGARQGWVEAPYVAVPAAPLQPASFRRVATSDARLAVTILHGLSQAEPADVMRGEETQLAGLMALEPGFEGLVCLPGTHTKWAWLAAGAVTRFQTFITGELFALLAAHSILRHSLAGEGTGSDAAGETAAFDQAVVEAAADAGGLSLHLFSIRASGILGAQSPAAARARLSGLLVGAEIAAMRDHSRGREVVVVGSGVLAGHYARALDHAGARPRLRAAEPCTLAGLAAAYRQLPAS
jgi:2-dehydro-3-deoxygalactonokinase